MRVWDFPPRLLCDKHLLAQHNEIHSICSINLHGGGFYNHPEVKRWRGHSNRLAFVHEKTKQEMLARGMNHNHHPDTVDDVSVSTEPIDVLWQSRADQIQVLIGKGCKCLTNLMKEESNA